jgi:hypothetical protein
VGQSLTAEDQLFILMQAGLYLSATRGGAPEARICYERAESLSHSLNRPLLLYSALMGQWRYSHATEKLTATIRIAQRVYLLAQEQDDAALMIGAYNALAGTLYFMGDFESAHQYAMRGAQSWRLESVQSDKRAAKLLPVLTQAVDGVQEVGASAVSVLCYEAQAKWHLGEIASSQTAVAGAISLANDFRATGALRGLPFFLALKAEALQLADRAFEALEAIREAEGLVEKIRRALLARRLATVPRCVSRDYWC